MKVLLIAAVVAMSGVACGAYQFPGGPTSPGASPSPPLGTVSGRVISVPCAPIEPAGSACAGRPVPKLELDFAGAAGSGKAITDSSGSYLVELPAGSYAVKLITYMRVLSGPSKLVVEAGSNTAANFVLDSGIRVPATLPPTQ